MAGPQCAKRIPLVIVGAGGFGREVADVVDACNAVAPRYDLIGFLDDGEPDLKLLEALGHPHLGGSEFLADLDVQYVIGIGSAPGRRHVAALAERAGRTAATLVHPTATIGAQSFIGAGTVVCAHASVTTNVTIGRHVHLNLACTVGHDAVLDDFVTVMPSANVSGNVTLGPGTTMGTGSCVIQGLTVGSDAFVGAGAAVIRDVDPGVTVVGVPARPRP